ncbi:hypothetical protein B0H14DRAFT_3888372 [Mycena olivaceomarginata]|nr:hypothetical protein B0H14DRAFT_3888372 [Mycena olivaceomarginata]
MTRGLISADGKPDTPAVQRGHSLAPTVPRLVLCPRSPALPQPSPLDAHGDSSQLLSRPHRTQRPPSGASRGARPRRRTHATHLSYASVIAPSGTRTPPIGLHTADGADAAPHAPLPLPPITSVTLPPPLSPMPLSPCHRPRRRYGKPPMTLSLSCNTLNHRKHRIIPRDNINRIVSHAYDAGGPLHHSSSYMGCRPASQAPSDSHSGRPLAERAVSDLQPSDGPHLRARISDCPISIHAVVDVIRPHHARNRRLYGAYLRVLGVALAGSLRALRHHDADATKLGSRLSSCIRAHAFIGVAFVGLRAMRKCQSS